MAIQRSVKVVLFGIGSLIRLARNGALNLKDGVDEHVAVATVSAVEDRSVNNSGAGVADMGSSKAMEVGDADVVQASEASSPASEGSIMEESGSTEQFQEFVTGPPGTNDVIELFCPAFQSAFRLRLRPDLSAESAAFWMEAVSPAAGCTERSEFYRAERGSLLQGRLDCP